MDYWPLQFTYWLELAHILFHYDSFDLPYLSAHCFIQLRLNYIEAV